MKAEKDLDVIEQLMSINFYIKGHLCCAKYEKGLNKI